MATPRLSEQERLDRKLDRDAWRWNLSKEGQKWRDFYFKQDHMKPARVVGHRELKNPEAWTEDCQIAFWRTVISDELYQELMSRYFWYKTYPNDTGFTYSAVDLQGVERGFIDYNCAPRYKHDKELEVMHIATMELPKNRWLVIGPDAKFWWNLEGYRYRILEQFIDSRYITNP